MSSYHNYIFYRNPGKKYPVVSHGKGVYLWDKNGRKYLDGSGGACVVNIGHGVEEIKEAMIAQAEKVSFAHSSQFTSEASFECAERICRMLWAGSLNKVYFLSGGSEAVETAIKLVRQYWRDSGKPDKYKIISRWSSFHGNTTGALSLSGHTERRKNYLPFFPHTPHVEPCYCYRCPYGLEPDSCNMHCAEELERCICREGPESVAAFIAEPIVGAAAGALVPLERYLERIREICDEYDVKLIADEVMTGIGRCGYNICMEKWKVIPDLVVLAKGLSSGYTPLGAVVVRDEIHNAIRRGSRVFMHGHTFAQNPLSTAVGARVLRYIEEHDLVERSKQTGELLFSKLQGFLDFDIVGDVRGSGLFAGIEFVQDKKTKSCFHPSEKVNRQVTDLAMSRGLIVYPGSGGANGIEGDHILLAPPFIISEKEIDEMISILRSAVLSTQNIIS